MRFRQNGIFLGNSRHGVLFFSLFFAVSSAVFLLFPFVPARAAVARVTTNDTFLLRQWYLDSIQARTGWTVATGSRDVIVAVIDSGVDIDHPDIKNNLWTNPGEIAGNGKDDDGDGYIDDVHGWNFVTNSPDVRPQNSATGIEEAYIHGTAVASMIAGEGNNNIGISGVAWHARIMPLVILDSDGYGRDDSLVAAIRYATAHGADIINFSLVGYEYDPQLAQAIREATAQGVLVVSAAGNSDAPGGTDLDKTPGYPACDKGIAHIGVLTVTALDQHNEKSNHANYGSCVDVSAPGSGIFAARPTHDIRDASKLAPGYVDQLSGTSVAAPLVSGLAVLLKAEHPLWRGPQIAERILDTADSVDDQNPAFRGKLGHGKIDVWRAVQNDAAAEALGPLRLEASAPGQSPQVRVLSSSGKEMTKFIVGDIGDRRGVRATFVRWQKDIAPDIAVSVIGDKTGAWRVYRPDGLLIAAGTLGTDIAGGVNLTANDIDTDGNDILLLSEAGGSRIWFVSAKMPPQVVVPFPKLHVRGIAAMSLLRPQPAFVVTSIAGDPVVSIIGRDGVAMSTQRIDSPQFAQPRKIQQFARAGESDVFQFTSGTTSLTFVSSPSGLDESRAVLHPLNPIQSPLGQLSEPGWMYFESWPR